jgi:RHS repeat-associated protein
MAANAALAAPVPLAGLARECGVSLRFWAAAGGLARLIQGLGSDSSQSQEKQSDRDTKVTSIQILPGDVTIDLSDRVSFSAVAYDQQNSPVGGVRFKWSAEGPSPKSRVRLSQRGEFEGTEPGEFTLTAEGAGMTAKATIVVQPGVRRNMRLTPTKTHEVSTRDVPSEKVGSTNQVNRPEPGVKTVSRTAGLNGTRIAPSSWTASRGRSSRVGPIGSIAPLGFASAGGNSGAVAKNRVANTTSSSPFLIDEGWSDTNYWSADDPGNRVGEPPGSPIDEGAGSGNFQFRASFISLQGRGINISLGLTYNSRLWNKAGTQISFDNDRGWPAPGFSLGFGKLLGMGVNNGGMLVEGDGSRHSYAGSVTYYPWGTYFVGHTTDGSFIDYSYWSGAGGAIVSGQARLANGTIINYGAAGPGAVYPTMIEDPNGNFITITYVGNSGPRIQTVTDTLGRVISFHYDANNLLTAVTVPGLSGGPVRTLARLHYHQLALSYGFSGLSASVRDPNPWVVDAIYYPGMNTGYWLNDSDSYSSYGMLAKMVEQRNMGFSAPSLTVMGMVSPGSNTRSETYNYPLTPNYSLTDAPTYTSMTESWTRDLVSFDSAITSYAVSENSSPRTVTITLPNGVKSTQQSFNHPGQYDDGLVFHDETRDAGNNLLRSSSTTWQPGAFGSPRPMRVERTDERGQMTAAEFSYGSVYNQLTEVRDYGYGGTALIRASRATYQNSASYTNRHIFNLPLSVEVYASDYATRVSRTEFQHDGQPLTQRADVIQHDLAFDPYAADEGYCYWDYDWNDPDCFGNCNPDFNICDGYCPQFYVCPYDSSTDFRGNVTQVTSYADAISLTGAVIETRRYDIAGNPVKWSASCCDQTTSNYTVNTQYAYPQSRTSGSPTDPYAQITTSAIYDFNTGLVFSTTDANGRQSQKSYDPATLRRVNMTLSTGARADYVFDDAGMSLTQTMYLAPADGSGVADQSVKYLNGRGQVRQKKALGAGGIWDYVDTIYEITGLVSQQSRPYRIGESLQLSTTTYDALGRVKTVTAPDGSVSQTFYDEATRPSVASSSPGETVRVRDAWGRERWGRADATGRLVEVVEPDPGGSGSVATNGLMTTYTYNTLGNLTQVTQGAQTRSFKYDSLGRLTAQKLAEMRATLNDAGTYVGTGTWSDVFTYDQRSNLTSRTDARGVKTINNYNGDPLNRLQSVSRDTSGFGDTANPILAAATVTYQYRTKSSPSDLKDILHPASVTTAGVSTESYSYDIEGRVSSKTLTLASRPAYPFVTDYIYDSMDRTREVRYPAEYGNGSAPRKVVHQDYDVASRLSSLTVDGQSFASNIVYNAASQTASLSVGSGAFQMNESYSYDAQTGLLSGQTLTRNASTLLSLSYDYAGVNGKRSGQLVKVSNNLDHNRDRGYEYDALGRLTRATGGQNVNWAQRYEYDRYGNRKNAFSYTAEQFVRNFFQSALNRQPNSSELQTWLTTLQNAYTQGQAAFLTAMQNLGEALFSSQEYVNRNRNNHDYVYDLYKAYLVRDPDSSGWAFWESQVANNGRVQVRTAFAVSTEFKLKVMGTSPYSPPGGATVPADGLQLVGFESSSNRINSAGFAYDAAGNQVRAMTTGGGSQRFQYDAANRLVKVKADDNTTVLATYTYGNSNLRLVAEEGGYRTYYNFDGITVIAEYVESVASATPAWSKSYLYVGVRLLSTLTPNGFGGEAVQHHHPDQLGTRIVSNPSNGTSFEQVGLPFGTALTSESTGTTNRRFTSYDRSATTGLDYAVNRHYDSQQGRFTQVDPIGMRSTTLASPQTLNLYAYCGNDPINRTDPTGLGFLSFFKKLFRIITKILTIVAIVAAVALVVSLFPGSIGAVGKALFGIIMKGMSFLGPLKFAAGAGGEGGWKLNPIGLVFTGLYGVGFIASRLQEQEPQDDGDVIKTTTSCPKDVTLPGKTPPLCPTFIILNIIQGLTLPGLVAGMFFDKWLSQIVVNTGASNSAQQHEKKDPCDVMSTPHHTSTAEFAVGEVLKEATGAPGTHPASAAGKIGSRAMPVLTAPIEMAPDIARIRLGQMCLERLAPNTGNPRCILDFTQCNK